MVVTRWSLPKAMFGLAVLTGACGGRVREHSVAEGGDGASTGRAPESTGGSPASDPQAPAGTGGASMTPGGAPGSTGGSPASGAGAVVIAGSAGAVAVAGSGGTTGDPTSNDVGAGGASPDASCDEAWGTPATDPGYRGLRGTLNGEPLSVDGKDINAGIGFCFDAGPGETPEHLGAYIPLPGMSLRLGSCGAEITSPDDTTWHQLDVELTAQILKPAANASDQPGWNSSLVSGHVRLQGQSASGPIIIDADLYLDLGVSNTCAPPPPRVG